MRRHRRLCALRRRLNTNRTSRSALLSSSGFATPACLAESVATRDLGSEASVTGLSAIMAIDVCSPTIDLTGAASHSTVPPWCCDV